MIGKSDKYPDMVYVIKGDFDKHVAALEELANKVVNLAVRIDEVSKKLDDHVETADAHNPGILRKK